MVCLFRRFTCSLIADRNAASVYLEGIIAGQSLETVKQVLQISRDFPRKLLLNRLRANTELIIRKVMARILKKIVCILY